jgi:hypothetical protein
MTPAEVVLTLARAVDAEQLSWEQVGQILRYPTVTAAATMQTVTELVAVLNAQDHPDAASLVARLLVIFANALYEQMRLQESLILYEAAESCSFGEAA